MLSKLIIRWIYLTLFILTFTPVVLGEPVRKPAYRIYNLGSTIMPWDINNKNEIVGKKDTSFPNYHAIYWKDNQLTDLHRGRGHSNAVSINEQGQIVGTSSTLAPKYGAFLYENGQMKGLGTFGGVFSVAESINNAGQIVGRSQTNTGESHIFLYENGQMKDLGNFGGTGSTAQINEAGHISVNVLDNNKDVKAYMYKDGSTESLGTLGGNETRAMDINDGDQVTGWSLTDTGLKHAFRWEDGMMRDLGALDRRTYESWAYGMNNTGQVVGRSQADEGGSSSFLWDRGIMYDLNDQIAVDSGWDRLKWATAINDNGYIVGWGKYNNSTHGFLLVPTGEPLVNGFPVNRKPIADAGEDQMVWAVSDGLATVRLDGSGSYDEDGNRLSYEWSWVVDGKEFISYGGDGIVNLLDFAVLAKQWQVVQISNLVDLSQTWLRESNLYDVAPRGPYTTIELPVGVHTITLVVNDGIVDSEPNSCVVTVLTTGDLDGDGEVDMDDMNILLAARNELATGPDDPRDLDGDGLITVLDARKLVTLFTR